MCQRSGFASLLGVIAIRDLRFVRIDSTKMNSRRVRYSCTASKITCGANPGDPDRPQLGHSHEFGGYESGAHPSTTIFTCWAVIFSDITMRESVSIDLVDPGILSRVSTPPRLSETIRLTSKPNRAVEIHSRCTHPQRFSELPIELIVDTVRDTNRFVYLSFATASRYRTTGRER